MEEKEEEEEEQETPPAPERKEKVVSPSETDDKPLTSPKQKEHTPARKGRNEPDSGTYFLMINIGHVFIVRKHSPYDKRYLWWRAVAWSCDNSS